MLLWGKGIEDGGAKIAKKKKREIEKKAKREQGSKGENPSEREYVEILKKD